MQSILNINQHNLSVPDWQMALKRFILKNDMGKAQALPEIQKQIQTDRELHMR